MMIIKNMLHAPIDSHSVLSTIYQAAIKAVQPDQLFANACRIDSNGTLQISRFLPSAHKFSNKLNVSLVDREVFLFGAGKAVQGMCEEFLKQVNQFNQKNFFLNSIQIQPSRINLPLNSKSLNLDLLTKYNVSYYPCGRNNIPDSESVQSTKEMLNFLEAIQGKINPLVIGFISGGGSALLALPKPEVSLEEKCKIIQEMVGKGANIVEINTVRSYLSQVKQGKLVRQLLKWNPNCQILVFLISDIVNDPLDKIASGPTVIEKSTQIFENAKSIFEKFSIFSGYPHLGSVFLNEIDENFSPEYFLLKNDGKIFNQIIGNNWTALQAAAKKALELNFEVEIISSNICGEARSVVKKLLDRVLSEYDFLKTTNLQSTKGKIWLAGGETTITMKNSSNIGTGGRCQEMGLLFIDELNQLNNVSEKTLYALFAGTDGQDGPNSKNPIAGVQVKWPLSDYAINWMDFHQALQHHDSSNFWLNNYGFVKNLDEKFTGLIGTGLTGTNVMDIYCIMIKF